MKVRTHTVEWAGGTVTSRIRGDGGPVMLLAHGAGTNQDHWMMTSLSEQLAARGLTVVTFNYPYTEAGRKAPDRAPKLMDCHRDVAAWVRNELGTSLVFAGRSMGGRIATMLASEGEQMEGVVVYAYPLHPAGKPDRLRVEHLPGIEVPMLFFQGDRDALATTELFDHHVRSLPAAEVVDLPGADHSWRVRGRSTDELIAEVAESSVGWIRRLATSG